MSILTECLLLSTMARSLIASVEIECGEFTDPEEIETIIGVYTGKLDFETTYQAALKKAYEDAREDREAYQALQQKMGTNLK